MFKSDNAESLTNYRPISVSTCFRKILEKVIYTQISAFFQKHSKHAVLDLITTVYDQTIDNEYTNVTLLDFKKAFDS